MAEQNHHAEKAPPHTETPTPPSSSPQPDHEKLNELLSSEPVHEQRESKKSEMVSGISHPVNLAIIHNW